jgi:hypothetical protein
MPGTAARTTWKGRVAGEDRLPVDAERLRADLATWRPELGRRGKELAWLHHDAGRYASALVELFRRLGAADRPLAAHGELARLVRV